ncbi:hypothetical protein DN069_14950 [Streptacidiphilus pinicola]|uniref:DUF4232 domain-containing protein n=1 Tax=Streptacidiphilus pinicola TaxID=2219663 RepID=A0A2X0IMR5_9ACTN|nr:DUF4232 domain-containing protein [Streptacidiphilus pinicola]RAG84833.1 hypothetical protein DN069_14950 [Streptacidiphilus pinicola]
MKRISVIGILAASALCLTVSACGGSGSPVAGAPASGSSTASAPAASGGSTGTTGSTGTGGTTGSTTGGSTGGSTTGGTGGTGGSTGSTGGGAGAAACTGSQITVGDGGGDAATGHETVVLYFTNVSGTACTLHGYPGVAGLDSAGHQAVQATRTLNGFTGGLAQGATTMPTVTVPAHGRASARLEWTDVPEGNATSCPTYHGVLVTPPGTRTSTRIASLEPNACTFQIHPVVPGSTGNQS